MKKPNLAILGCSGAVGQELLSLIEERNFQFESLKLLASARSAGKKLTFQGTEYTIEEATPESFNGVDIILSSAGGSISKDLLPHAVKAGAVCVDNTSAYRMDPEVPLVVPEINPEDIDWHKGIIANPNCSTIIMLVPLFPIHKQSKIKRIVAATYQAASGAGAQAMQELEDQTREILDGKEPTKNAFPYQIAFNLFSHNSGIDEEGTCEEEAKMVRETKKIFHDEDIHVAVTTIRIPILRAHSEVLYIECEDAISHDQARELLSSAPGVKVIDDREQNYFPMPLEASGQDDILVGRLRDDKTVAHGISMFVCGDQIRKGAALNAIQIAEILAKQMQLA